MDVKNLKLHSNYLQPSVNFGSKKEGRTNKLHPNSSFDMVCSDSKDMCIVSDKSFKKTIVTNKSNGLSFKGRYDMLYKIARAVVDENMPAVVKIGKNGEKIVQDRAWYLARRARFDKVAETFKKNNPFLYKAVTNQKFLKAMKFMNDNALLSDAGIALFYTCCMRPLSIAALPTKDDKEKKKNIYQIGHSISTGIIGFVTAFAIQTPIKDAINKITQAVTSKQAEKYINIASKDLFSKESIEKTRTILERSHQPISLPLKAALTIYLVPRILKVFGLTKNQKTEGKDNNNSFSYDAFQYFAAFKGNKNAKNNFKGGLNNAN